MSHLSIIRTEIRSLEIAVATARQLGLAVLEAGDVSAMDGRRAACVIRLDHTTRRTYLHGLLAETDGTYTLVGERCGEPAAFLDCFGPHWRYQSERGRYYDPNQPLGPQQYVTVTSEQAGPTRFLQEYALQSAVWIGSQQGMFASRQPADPAADDAPDGGEKIVLTGGYLPPQISLHVVGLPDGTCRVRIDGATSSACYEYTRPFEDALGAVLADVSTLDLAHSTYQGQTCHYARP